LLSEIVYPLTYRQLSSIHFTLSSVGQLQNQHTNAMICQCTDTARLFKSGRKSRKKGTKQTHYKEPN